MRQKLKPPSKLSAVAIRSGAQPYPKPRRRCASAVVADASSVASAAAAATRRAIGDLSSGTSSVYMPREKGEGKRDKERQKGTRCSGTSLAGTVAEVAMYCRIAACAVAGMLLAGCSELGRLS